MKHFDAIILLTLIFVSTASAQNHSALSSQDHISAGNRVLELDGRGDYVQLPGDIFNHLDEATVEGWVKWKSFGSFSQPFGFGVEWRMMGVNTYFGTTTLQFFIYDANGQLHQIGVDRILQLHQWFHIVEHVASGRGMWRRNFRLPLKKRQTLSLSLKPAGSISGQLLAFDKTPHAGILVQAVRIIEAKPPNKATALEYHEATGTLLSHLINL